MNTRHVCLFCRCSLTSSSVVGDRSENIFHNLLLLLSGDVNGFCQRLDLLTKASLFPRSVNFINLNAVESSVNIEKSILVVVQNRTDTKLCGKWSRFSDNFIASSFQVRTVPRSLRVFLEDVLELRHKLLKLFYFTGIRNTRAF